jgi:hypothetical protein
MAYLFGIVHFEFIAINCLKVLKIPPFGILYKKIKIAQYRLHLTWKREQEEEMRFQKRQVHTKKTPKFLPIIPLLPTKLSSDELKDKGGVYHFYVASEQRLGSRNPDIQEEHQDL